jgi:hypothetical protein
LEHPQLITPEQLTRAEGQTKAKYSENIDNRYQRAPDAYLPGGDVRLGVFQLLDGARVLSGKYRMAVMQFTPPTSFSDLFSVSQHHAL